MSDKLEPLGNNAKFASASVSEWAVRYALQEVAGDILPEERVRKCSRHLIPSKKDVEVNREKSGKSAWYRNLQICASVWMCPVCAHRITEGRRVEVQQCLDNINCRKILVTYTLRHSRDDVLSVVLEGLTEAYKAMWSGRWQVSFKDDWGYLGAVKTIEVTHGKNGFHPHIHTILFLNCSSSTEELETQLLSVLRVRWLHCLEMRGRDASWEYGLKATAVYSSVAEYVTKWGREPANAIGWNIASEVTKSPVKRAHADGFTPLQMLYKAALGEGRYRALWSVYATTFKGTPQVRISPLLREMAGLTSASHSDGDLAGGSTVDSYLFASISHEDWRIVVRKGARGRLLDLAKVGDIEEFLSFMQSLGCSLGCSLGEFETATDMMRRLVENRNKS
jgi:hypothetical protein